MRGLKISFLKYCLRPNRSYLALRVNIRFAKVKVGGIAQRDKSMVHMFTIRKLG
jgi:hypothetical protein